jgi:hypothetical protein
MDFESIGMVSVAFPRRWTDKSLLIEFPYPDGVPSDNKTSTQIYACLPPMLMGLRLVVYLAGFISWD